MFIPEGYTEEQVLADMTHVVEGLARHFRFGYHDIEDMKQEGYIILLEALSEYDGSSALRTFLYTHLRNRYINMKRDQYSRNKPPCVSCPFWHGSSCAEFDPRTDCDRYQRWVARNAAKRNLMESYDATDIRNEGEPCKQGDIGDQLADTELTQLIDKRIPLRLRADYRRMLEGIRLPKPRRIKVEEAVKKILMEVNDGEEER
jgi:DNA-directed RNA polymerase specialized sigma24 family protein